MERWSIRRLRIQARAVAISITRKTEPGSRYIAIAVVLADKSIAGYALSHRKRPRTPPPFTWVAKVAEAHQGRERKLVNRRCSRGAGPTSAKSTSCPRSNRSQAADVALSETHVYVLSDSRDGRVVEASPMKRLDIRLTL